MGEPIVYLNGQYLPMSEARIGMEDRGFQFADGIYEVIRIYGGKPFRLKEHLARFENSAREIGLTFPGAGVLADIATELIRRNSSDSASLYMQMTRGVCPRKHAVPDGIEPTIVMTVRETAGYPMEFRKNGVKAITLSDDRWSRCYIKTTNLLPNCMAKRKAMDAGAYEAIYIRDGYVTEGSSCNVFIVESGSLVTPQLSNYILSGVTRSVIIEMARGMGIGVKEEHISAERLIAADEVYVTGTLTEIMPVVNIDGHVIGKGVPGPVYARLYPAYVALYTEETKK